MQKTSKLTMIGCSPSLSSIGGRVMTKGSKMSMDEAAALALSE
jgi:hypothetical protein